jgi:hypothetical protein
MEERMLFSSKVNKETTALMDIYLVLLVDTHGFHRRMKIPENDIVIFAGDYIAD